MEEAEAIVATCTCYGSNKEEIVFFLRHHYLHSRAKLERTSVRDNSFTSLQKQKKYYQFVFLKKSHSISIKLMTIIFPLSICIVSYRSPLLITL